MDIIELNIHIKGLVVDWIHTILYRFCFQLFTASEIVDFQIRITHSVVIRCWQITTLT